MASLIKLTTLDDKKILVSIANIAWIQKGAIPDNSLGTAPAGTIEISVIYFNFLAPRDLSQTLEVKETVEQIEAMIP